MSEMIRRMDDEGLVTINRSSIALTDTGVRLAQAVVRRHRLAERFLTDVLELSWTEAHHEAGKWEHIISDRVERALVRLLGDPTTCPHGNPIPGSSYAPPATVALAEMAVGHTFTVCRIPEELEFEPGLLEFLERSSILPGESGQVTAAAPDGTVTINIAGGAVGVGRFASERIQVLTGSAPEPVLST